MSYAKLCPNCGNVLQRAVAGSFTAVYYLGMGLLFWVAVTFVFAFVMSPRGAGELYAALAVIAILGWFFLRSRRRRSGGAPPEGARYYCAQCHNFFEGNGLRHLNHR